MIVIVPDMLLLFDSLHEGTTASFIQVDHRHVASMESVSTRRTSTTTIDAQADIDIDNFLEMYSEIR